MTDHDLTRRAFGGAAVVGAAVPLLAACGPGNQSSAGGSGGSTGGSSGGSGSGKAGLVAATDVPVQGGVVVQSAQVVVTQPVKGEFKCFSAVCTHMGCLVASVQQDVIACPCHGSTFSAKDGSVLNGPATRPLQSIPVKVKGGEVAEA